MACTTLTTTTTALTAAIHNPDTNERFTLAMAAKERSSLATSGFFPNLSSKRMVGVSIGLPPRAPRFVKLLVVHEYVTRLRV
ncbi:hypothetical protein SNOG_16307 [Parastagonospora nodorum SN15]|uniref:Uncharacterized protein n=1 Tax=Phaeosphaeria nodorum (strain SN15 / ATCC MYA-4574 / FGSC 10173) TaxID=321614 RepID=Q0TVZ2_PHANO|nr:hypothetical protein SNOG_16307 [Parastagonospora nodorum SN15]EAT76293.1 hypothetical protein SNOG_16307 [Parastagonospora nodorum SN15]